MDKQHIPLIVAVAYIVLNCIVMMVIGYQVSKFDPYAHAIDAIEYVNGIVSGVWVAGILVLILVFILYFSTSKPKIEK